LSVTRAALSNQAVAIGDLIELMNQDLKTSPVLLMDDTTVQVLKEKKGPPGKKSYMWVVRGYHEGKPIHRFAYHSNRSGSFAEELLKGFTGQYVQTDGFDGYNRLDGRSDLIHVGCFAHIRRKFVSAWETAGKTGIAKPCDRYHRTALQRRGDSKSGAEGREDKHRYVPTSKTNSRKDRPR